MPLSLLYSSLLHILVFSLLLFCVQGQAPNKKKQATYTIDFIGSSSGPMRYGDAQPPAQVQQPAQQESAPVKQEEQTKQESSIKTEQTKAKPAYNAQAQITKKKQKKSTKKEEKIVLSKPSILKEVQSADIDVSQQHNLSSGPGEETVRASFTNFPYPWYITQVRNSLWSSWQKLMPKKTIGLSVLVAFNIEKDGTISEVKIEQSSKNEDFDYKGKVAVLNSAPYPPLPQDFGKESLSVVVEFKNE